MDVSPETGLSYDPREEAPHLLEEFTSLRSHPDEYARFASQWGFMGYGRAVHVPRGDEEPPQPPLECTADWERVALEIRAVAELHGALKARDRKAIDRLVTLQDGWLWFDDGLRVESERLLALAGDDQLEHRDEWDEDADLSQIPLFAVATAECPDRDIARAAWELLAWAVNTRTQRLIGYGLRPTKTGAPSELRLQLTHRGQLYAWLWLQLAERIASGAPMQRCASCRAWYYQHPGARRRHGIYCSTRCRVAAWRGRRAARNRSGARRVRARSRS